MQTTLRIDDDLYRQAKAEAARQGVTLARFLEEGIRLRLARRPGPIGGAHPFRVYESPAPADLPGAEEIARVAEEEQENADLARLGIGPSKGRS